MKLVSLFFVAVAAPLVVVNAGEAGGVSVIVIVGGSLVIVLLLGFERSKISSVTNHVDTPVIFSCALSRKEKPMCLRAVPLIS